MTGDCALAIANFLTNHSNPQTLNSVKERGSHGALRSQPADDLSRPDREPLRSPSYLVLRLVRPLVQARQSAVRRDAAPPALISVPGVRGLVSRRRRTCNRC